MTKKQFEELVALLVCVIDTGKVSPPRVNEIHEWASTNGTLLQWRVMANVKHQLEQR